MTKRKTGRPRKAGSPPADPGSVNPLAVLAGIASDVHNAPPTARVTAAKALLAARERYLLDADTDEATALKTRALKLLRGGKP